MGGRGLEESNSEKTENKSKGSLQECRDSDHCSFTLHESGRQQGWGVQLLSQRWGVLSKKANNEKRHKRGQAKMGQKA